MHEASLIRTLLTQVGALLVANQGDSVDSIVVELGPLSGVEPLLVKSAFDQLVATSPLAGARLEIHEVPLEAKCRQCQAEFEVRHFRFLCPNCASTDVQVVRGDEFRLISITIQKR